MWRKETDPSLFFSDGDDSESFLRMLKKKEKDSLKLTELRDKMSDVDLDKGAEDEGSAMLPGLHRANMSVARASSKHSARRGEMTKRSIPKAIMRDNKQYISAVAREVDDEAKFTYQVLIPEQIKKLRDIWHWVQKQDLYRPYLVDGFERSNRTGVYKPSKALEKPGCKIVQDTSSEESEKSELLDQQSSEASTSGSDDISTSETSEETMDEAKTGPWSRPSLYRSARRPDQRDTVLEVMDVVKPLCRQGQVISNTVTTWAHRILCSSPDKRDNVEMLDEELFEFDKLCADTLSNLATYFQDRAKLMADLMSYPHVDDFRTALNERDENQIFKLSFSIRQMESKYLCLRKCIGKVIEKSEE